MRRPGRASWSVTVGGGGPCPTCGSEGRVVTTPTQWARLRGWLTSHTLPSTLRCFNGHEWAGRSTSWLKAGRSTSWWSWPARALRVLLAHRTAEPAPIIWLAAALVGVTLGIVMQVLLDWPWWAVAAAWLAAVWLTFLATALRPLARDGLWVDVVRTGSPLRAERLDTEQLIRLAEAAPGPVYGLAEWTGPRSLGGHGRSSRVGLTHLDLIHGEAPYEPHLRVDTRWDDPTDPTLTLGRVRHELARDLWNSRVVPPEGLDSDELHRWAIERRTEIGKRPDPEWTPLRIQIDESIHTADMYAEDDDWVALIDLHVAVVRLHSHGIPTSRVTLTRLEDLTPYLET